MQKGLYCPESLSYQKKDGWVHLLIWNRLEKNLKSWCHVQKDGWAGHTPIHLLLWLRLRPLRTFSPDAAQSDWYWPEFWTSLYKCCRWRDTTELIYPNVQPENKIIIFIIKPECRNLKFFFSFGLISTRFLREGMSCAKGGSKQYYIFCIIQWIFWPTENLA